MEEPQMEKSHEKHNLSDKWVLWAHLPHDTNWSLKSYIKICKIENAEDIIALNNSLPDQLIKNCMLFLMRDNILPMWEDPKNCDGGCFSFKIVNKNVASVWKEISYLLTGDVLSNDQALLNNITGLTVSPKKSFCILKIWLSTLKFQNVKKIKEIENLPFHGCIFKKHKP
jgi:hypothetical protein